MKIRTLVPDGYDKVSALLRRAFSGSGYEVRLVENFHKNNRDVHEWVCVHTNRVIAYVSFSNAYNGSAVCGLHLGPLAVKPEFLGQGIGSELLRFAFRQDVIRETTVYVLGDSPFYHRFGFEPCQNPVCPFTENNEHFLSIGNTTADPFTVGYDPDFTA